jgi:hypothetical protein
LTLQCSGTGGNDQESVTITVNGGATPTSSTADSGGGAMDLLWLLGMVGISALSALRRLHESTRARALHAVQV